MQPGAELPGPLPRQRMQPGAEPGPLASQPMQLLIDASGDMPPTKSVENDGSVAASTLNATDTLVSAAMMPQPVLPSVPSEAGSTADVGALEALALPHPGGVSEPAGGRAEEAERGEVVVSAPVGKMAKEAESGEVVVPEPVGKTAEEAEGVEVVAVTVSFVTSESASVLPPPLRASLPGGIPLARRLASNQPSRSRPRRQYSYCQSYLQQQTQQHQPHQSQNRQHNQMQQQQNNLTSLLRVSEGLSRSETPVRQTSPRPPPLRSASAAAITASRDLGGGYPTPSPSRGGLSGGSPPIRVTLAGRSPGSVGGGGSLSPIRMSPAAGCSPGGDSSGSPPMRPPPHGIGFGSSGGGLGSPPLGLPPAGRSPGVGGGGPIVHDVAAGCGPLPTYPQARFPQASSVRDRSRGRSSSGLVGGSPLG